MYEDFVKDFKDDEVSLLEEPVSAEKELKEYERREKEEMKRVDKIFRKENTEIEDLFNDTSISGEKGLK